MRNKNRARFWVLFVIWVLSTAFATPFAITTSTKTVPLHVEVNGQVRLRDVTFLNIDMEVEDFKIYYMTLFVSLHVIPFFFLAILYIRIAWKLWHPDKNLAETDRSYEAAKKTVSGMSERNRRKTTLMVIAVLVVFFVCFFPFHLYFIITKLFNNFQREGTTETSILRVILALNAAANPIIYNLLSENFRAKFRAILSCGPREQVGNSSNSLTRPHIVRGQFQ